VTRSIPTFAFLATVSAMGWPPAAATPLAPGGAVVPVGTTTAADPNRVGVVVDDPLRLFVIMDGLGNVIVEGALQDRVTRSTPLGTLMFEPRLRNTIGTGVIVGLLDRGFAGFSTDVEFLTSGAGDVGPDEISRGAAAGDELTFEYEPSVIDPPQEALFLSVLTDATGFAPIGTTTIFARDLTGALFFVTLENTNAPVPEPSALALGGLALIGLARSRRRGLVAGENHV
jgi:hypothetical protein